MPHTQQRWSEQPSVVSLQVATGRPWALLRYDDDDEQASGFQKSGQAFGGSSRRRERECAQQVEHLRTMCTPRWNREASPSVCKVRRMGWSAGLVQKHHALFVQNRVLVSSLAPDGGGEVCCRMRRRWGASVLTTSTLQGRLADSKRRASATSTPTATSCKLQQVPSPPSCQGR